jgi:hypothetical protein
MPRLNPERRANPYLILSLVALVGMLVFNVGLAVWALVFA